MKSQSFKLAAAALIISISAVLVSAYSVTSPSVTFEVPFDFQIGNKEFSKGKYRLSRESQTLLLIESLEGTDAKLIVGGPTGASLSRFDQSQLTFYRYGDNYFLREVNSPGVSAYVRVSSDEKEARKHNKKHKKVTLGGA